MYLGIDVGTQSVKAVLYDPEAQALAGIASSPLALISNPDGTREQQAEWWLQALRHCLAALAPAARANVQAIGVSGQQHGFVPLSATGDVLAPVKLWCDTATVAECDEISAFLGGEAACIAELGNPVLPGYTASKILWLKKNCPDAYDQMETILLPHDYVNFYLTGEKVMEFGDASGSGLMNVRERRWHPAALRAIDSERDLADCLPELIAADVPAGRLRDAVADSLGLPRGVPVSAGGGDNMMAAIGTGNVRDGAITISLGTSGTLFAYSDTPVVSEDGSFAAFCSSTGGWLPLVCTMNCTVATELGRDLLRVSLDEMETLVSDTVPGAGGVVTVPFFNGERTPNLPQAKGCLFGLEEGNYTRGNLLRSAMESSVYGLRSGLESLQAQGLGAQRIRLTGGGAQSALWRQMVADIFNLPVTVQTIDEGAALGAALQAMWMHSAQSGGAADIADIVTTQLAVDDARACEPAAERVGQYAAFYQNYQHHVQAVSGLYSKH